MAMRPITRAAIVAVGLALVAAVGVGLYLLQAPSQPRGERKHLVLVSIDTLRADYVAAYGHPYVQTPTLDALAARGVLFEQHISAAPTTLASHTALMTGTWPHTHGVPRNGFQVHSDNIMLAEVLADAGFNTAAFVGAYPLAKRFGFAQGFTHYSQQFSQKRKKSKGAIDQTQRPADEVTDDVLSWVKLRRYTTDRMFLFVHYFDVHAPYVAPEPYAGMYRDDELPVTGSLDDLDKAKRMLKRKRRNRALDTGFHDAMKREYAAGVTWVDAELGRLFSGLDEQGILGNSVVVVTSDHGEAMDEHWEHWNHGNSVFDTTVRTPLIVALPDPDAVTGRRITPVVSNIDVMPSVLELLGVPAPHSVEGNSFATAFDPAPFEPTRRQAYAEATKPYGSAEKGQAWKNARKARAVRGEQWKVVSRPLARQVQLFDVKADPEEQNDLAGTEPERMKILHKRLKSWSARANPKGSTKDADSTATKLLEALGYVDDSPDEPPPEEQEEEQPLEAEQPAPDGADGKGG